MPQKNHYSRNNNPNKTHFKPALWCDFNHKNVGEFAIKHSQQD